VADVSAMNANSGLEKLTLQAVVESNSTYIVSEWKIVV
jgi:hypothetical protein